MIWLHFYFKVKFPLKLTLTLPLSIFFSNDTPGGTTLLYSYISPIKALQSLIYTICNIFLHLELRCLGVGDMSRLGLRDLLSKLVCYIFLRTLQKEREGTNSFENICSGTMELIGYE